MQMGWINGLNGVVVASLILINVIVARKGLCENLRSASWPVNLFEQIGRYGCMLFMILPAFARNWEFGFDSVAGMLLWLGLTLVLLAVYILLWTRKRRGGTSILYGLAIVPVLLFFANGILLRHPALIAASLVFGGCHLRIVQENSRPERKS